MSTEKIGREVYDALDQVNTRLAWLQAISILISSQAERSEMHSDSYLSNDDWGNTGWLIGHLLDETRGLIDLCFEKLKEVTL